MKESQLKTVKDGYLISNPSLQAFHGKDYDKKNPGSPIPFMFDVIAILSLCSAIGLLIVLSAIDLKHWILPDKLNLSLGIAGLVFHFTTGYAYLPVQEMLIGAVVGAGMLYTIRFFANRHYGMDTLGLGDVKLMGAAGIWLGIEGVLMAVTVGAFAGLVHGIFYAAYIAYKNKTRFSINQLSIPAGPGFAVGILAIGYLMFSPFVRGFLYAQFS